MVVKKFAELPFTTRPDLTPYLLHFTKSTEAEDDFSAYENLLNILMEGKIRASHPRRGMIKGQKSATCFMDIPFASVKYLLTPENTNSDRPRYQAYGVLVGKEYAYEHLCRPVLYLSNAELKKIGVPPDELWRVVRFEANDRGWVSWLHEREWRCKGGFTLPKKPRAVFVKSLSEVRRLNSELHKHPTRFKCIPQSILPLEMITQGLL